ncbi:NAD(P)-binding protein, partial [Aquisalimonas sp.]|uniref:NAD(P)-binding protein n=1 Tax=Aquisalimonas sp. TaxID=1872621 RepID=UPI0025B98E54
MNQPHTISNDDPVAVIGAGPVGLAAAAHLLEQGLEPVIFEVDPAPGRTFRDVAHVRLFSPWRYNIDDAAGRLLDAVGWQRPDPNALPTAGELLHRYLEPLAAHPDLAKRLRLATRVTGITRQGVDKVRTRGRDAHPLLLRVSNGAGRDEEHLAAAVLDATGTWAHPNPLGASGLPAMGEEQFAEWISYGMPDVLGRERTYYEGRTILVVGAGHSAAGNLLALAKLADVHPGTRIHWAVRGATPHRLLGQTGKDSLPARGALGERVNALLRSGHLTPHAGFPIQEIRASDGRMMVIPTSNSGREPLQGIDRIIAATGSRPDMALARELRVQLDPALECVPALAPLVDPNEHSCGTVAPHGHRELAQPEPGFYIVGAKSYGRAPTFLMSTGYEQVRSIAAALGGDLPAADNVALELPATGVCGAPGTGA